MRGASRQRQLGDNIKERSELRQTLVRKRRATLFGCGRAARDDGGQPPMRNPREGNVCVDDEREMKITHVPAFSRQIWTAGNSADWTVLCFNALPHLDSDVKHRHSQQTSISASGLLISLPQFGKFTRNRESECETRD